MEMLVYALAAYGLVFGVQQKLPFIRQWKLHDLWECPYCLGFWAGWLTWGASWALGKPVFAPVELQAARLALAGLTWALAIAALCVLLESVSEKVSG